MARWRTGVGLPLEIYIGLIYYALCSADINLFSAFINGLSRFILMKLFRVGFPARFRDAILFWRVGGYWFFINEVLLSMGFR